MSFGINGADPFKSYASNAEAGGSMGVYARRKKKKDGKKENDNENSMTEADYDDDNLEVDIDDDFLL